MPLCGALRCGLSTADLKCARCQGVFYCNAQCQKADWKRHKPYCKHLSSPAASSSSAATPQLRQSRSSISKIDRDLFDVVDTFVQQVRAGPASLQNELAPALARVKILLARGARPDVFICSPGHRLRLPAAT